MGGEEGKEGEVVVMEEVGIGEVVGVVDAREVCKIEAGRGSPHERTSPRICTLDGGLVGCLLRRMLL